MRPAGVAEDTGIFGAAKLFSDCEGTGSQPRPIHEKREQPTGRRYVIGDQAPQPRRWSSMKRRSLLQFAHKGSGDLEMG